MEAHLGWALGGQELILILVIGALTLLFAGTALVVVLFAFGVIKFSGSSPKSQTTDSETDPPPQI